jgi:hypothetical protein
LFHPATESRTFRSGVYPLHTATLPHREELPPCRWAKSARPRMGCHRSEPSTSRPCSVRRRRSTGSVVSLPGDRSPPRFPSLLQVFPLPLVPKDQTSMVFLGASSTGSRNPVAGAAQPTSDAFTAGGLMPRLRGNDLPELLEPSSIARFVWAAPLYPNPKTQRYAGHGLVKADSKLPLRSPLSPQARRPSAPPGSVLLSPQARRP